jgi:hypothetical protein
VRREQELTVESKQLELADLADRYSFMFKISGIRS